MQFIRCQSTIVRDGLLSGQHALITGGATGIGYGIAKKLASEGCKITMVSRNQQNLETRRLELNQLTKHINVEHQFIPVDLTDHRAIETMFKTERDALGDVNILVNNSGMTQGSLLSRTTDVSLANIVDLNLTVPMILTKYFTNHVLTRRSRKLREEAKTQDNEDSTKQMVVEPVAHVINVSSVLANIPVTGAVVYSASKAGLIGFTRTFAHEMGPRGIRCNAVLPGLVANTDIGKSVNLELMQQKSVLKDTEGVTVSDVADACYYLISNAKITGQCLTVDNGVSIS